jgi:O-antigen ligase
LKQTNKIWYLLASFIVIAPLSTSSDASTAMKMARAGISLLGFIFCYQTNLIQRLNPIAKSLWSFALLFAISALWSDNIAWGLFNKSLFLLTATLGFGSVYSVTSTEDLLKRLRLLGFVAAFSSLGLLYMVATAPAEELGEKRLTIGGMNANIIGASAAPLFLLCLFLLLRPQKALHRGIHFSTAIVLLSIIMATGSRGSFMMVALGFIFIMRPVLKKNMFMATFIILIPVVVYYLFTETLSGSQAPTTSGFERITSTEDGTRSADTRAPVWDWAMKRFKTSPVIGVGWMHFGNNSANVHSVYILILAECGLIGALLFFLVLIKLPSTFLSHLQITEHHSASYDLTFFAGGVLAAHLLHGMVESSTLFGSTVNCLFFGLGIGILDRVLELDSSQPVLEKEQENLHPWAFQRQLHNRSSQTNAST